MKEDDKNIENLIDKMMADQTLESPSIDFTSKIMSQVLIIETSKAKVYKPLISKSAWLVIGCSLIGLSIYTLLGNDNLPNSEMTKLYSDKATALFSGMHFSKNILYSLLIVPFMLFIQIGVLKNYFDKKYEV
ncbi:hypothetical protein [Flavobacterium hercynium]|uniref:Uncharacterized protein n=1 Tax=Flavobacterium hercynium TaxID=387094 RepID=A0A226HJJ3_9FLAO|nr:hypothetical protein [Flavobacterium hercynium]OXA94345.1 hypothetical protein B0A66_04625 [Flavobacterium hercynium]SMP29046.1 hypothetical protein SAMN06265346_11213 [Flavobacterium hercynium]